MNKPFNSKARLSIIILIFIQLLGCGGGGGDTAIQAPPPPTVTDTIPPTVTQTVPLNYAVDVEQDTLIQVGFSELMNSSTINNSSFVVKDATDNIVSGVITESNTTYLFTPDSPLKFDTSYSVTITTDVTDLANNNLENTYSWIFYTVKVPGPTTPATLDASNITDTSATLNGLFTNPLNDTTAAWFEYGLTDSYGSTTPSTVYLAAATIDHSADLTNLSEKTTYHYRIVTQNNDGIFYGEDKSFRTYITPVVLVDDLDGPGYHSLKLHNNELYWAEIYTEAVRKIAVTGGSASIEATSNMAGNTISLDMDMTHLYWGDYANAWMKPIGTGSGSLIASSLPDVYNFRIYLTDLYVRHSDPISGNNISKIDIGSGALTTIITKDQYTITSYDVDASGIYWNNSLDGTISKANHDGTSEVTLAAGLNKPYALLLDAGKIYWAESNAIKSMNTSGGQISTIATNVSPDYLAKDSTHIYFADPVAGLYNIYNISNVNIATGEVTVLTQVDDNAISIVVDDTHVYWLTYGNHWYPPLGKVIKCAKSY